MQEIIHDKLVVDRHCRLMLAKVSYNDKPTENAKNYSPQFKVNSIDTNDKRHRIFNNNQK